MSSELEKVVNEYNDSLVKRLNDASKELEQITNKFNQGETLTSEEFNRNYELRKEMSEISRKLGEFDNLRFYEKMQEELLVLAKSRTLAVEKARIVTFLTEQFKIHNEEVYNRYPVQNLFSVDANEQELKDIAYSLDNELRIAKKRGFNTEDIQKDINAIVKYHREYVDLDELAKNLNIIKDRNVLKKDKQELIDKYYNLIENKKNAELERLEAEAEKYNIKEEVSKDEEVILLPSVAEEVENLQDEERLTKDNFYIDEDEQENKEIPSSNVKPTIKERFKKGYNHIKGAFAPTDETYNDPYDYDYEETKDELESKNKEEKKSNKVRNGIIATVVVGSCILIAALSRKNCTTNNRAKSNDNNHSLTMEDMQLESSYTSLSNNESSFKVEDSKIAYSMDEDAISYANKNNSESSSMVEESSIILDTNKDYNEKYKEVYDFVEMKYVIPESKAVDYVNRAYKIMDTNYFYDADIYDIVDVLVSIDNKEILLQDKADELQAIYNPINDIAEKYLFGENTEEDIIRLEAIKYFAKDGSDLGDFYNRFSDLSQDIIENPTDNEIKDEMYSLVSIYASSLNHYDNIACVLTDDEKFNEDAQVRDALDYAIAYRTVIAPSMFMLDPKEVEDIDGMLIERYASIEDTQERENAIIADGYEDYLPYIIRAIDIDGVDHLIQTGIDNNTECKKLTLGGE